MNFKITTSILIFLCFLNSAQASFTSHWTLSSSIDGVKVWQVKSHPDITGSWQERVITKKIDWSTQGKESLFKSLEAQKKKMLSFVGISDWQANRYHWATHPKGHELNIEGQYTDSSGQKITFKEIHIFAADKTIQILHTRPSSQKDGQQYSDEFFEFIQQEIKQ